VARHAGASAVDVGVVVDDLCTARVRDNGVGIGEHDRRSGLQNLADRAADRDGAFTLAQPDGGGTEAIWQVPHKR
jgi:signal transduction histidine kinase